MSSRGGGWDTHGLPVEIEVQKRLDLMSNEAIEAHGMEHSTNSVRRVCGPMSRLGAK